MNYFQDSTNLLRIFLERERERVSSEAFQRNEAGISQKTIELVCAHQPSRATNIYPNHSTSLTR